MTQTIRPLRLTQPYALSTNFTRGKYLYERLSGTTPVAMNNTIGITALATAAAAQVDSLRTSNGNLIEMYQTTAQTLFPVAHATKGLVLDGDQVDNESAEFVPGGNSATSPFAFVVPPSSTTVAADTDFYFKATFEITDASGSDQFIMGFRKVQAYQVPVSILSGGTSGYTDYFGIGFASAKADPNPVYTSSSIGSAVSVTTATNFTFADTTIHTFEIRVVGGRVLAYINGVLLGGTVSFNALGAAITAQPTFTGASYTFTPLLTLIPFIFVRQDADLLDAVYLRDYEIGHLVDVGKDPNNE